MTGCLRPLKHYAGKPDQVDRRVHATTTHKLSVDDLMNLCHQLKPIMQRISKLSASDHAPDTLCFGFGPALVEEKG